MTQQDAARWNRTIDRKKMLGLFGAAGTLVVVGCSDDDPAPAQSNSASTAQSSGASTPVAPTQTASGTAAQLTATPSCDDGDDATPAQTEGPYFKPNSPERTSLLETGMAGTRLTVAGFVLTTGCKPVAGALIDFWQADAAGQYDNAGYRLRGHQFTDSAGRYRLETVVPGLYPGRTRHIHVKVQAPSRPVLTTQLYFPNEPGNARDGIYMKETEMAVKDAGSAKEATFNFVLNV